MAFIATPSRQSGDDPVSPSVDASRQDAGSSLASKYITLRERFDAEIEADHPAGSFLEHLVHREAARSAAALGIVEDCLIAIYRAADQGGSVAGDPSDQANARLLTAMKSPVLTKLAQFQSTQRRGLFDAARLLERLQDFTPEGMPLPEVMRTEVDCANYLRDWQQTRTWRCPSCLGNTRSWLADRQVLQCRCGYQYSVRYGTVYEKSHVPLLTWFTVVGYAVAFPDITGGQIARQIGYRRAQTISLLLARIRQSLNSADANEQLAYVNNLVARKLCEVLRASRSIP